MAAIPHINLQPAVSNAQIQEILAPCIHRSQALDPSTRRLRATAVPRHAAEIYLRCFLIVREIVSVSPCCITLISCRQLSSRCASDSATICILDARSTSLVARTSSQTRRFLSAEVTIFCGEASQTERRRLLGQDCPVRRLTQASRWSMYWVIFTTLGWSAQNHLRLRTRSPFGDEAASSAAHVPSPPSGMQPQRAPSPARHRE